MTGFTVKHPLILGCQAVRLSLKNIIVCESKSQCIMLISEAIKKSTQIHCSSVTAEAAKSNCLHLLVVVSYCCSHFQTNQQYSTRWNRPANLYQSCPRFCSWFGGCLWGIQFLLLLLVALLDTCSRGPANWVLLVADICKRLFILLGISTDRFIAAYLL